MDADRRNLIVALDKMVEMGVEFSEEDKNFILNIIDDMQEYEASFWTNVILTAFWDGFTYGREMG